MGRHHRGALLVFLWSLSIASGCGDIGAAGPCEPTADSLERAVFAASCNASNCHAAADPALGVDLETRGAALRMVERPSALCDRLLVVPGNPDASYLYEKLSSAQPSCGVSMPVGGHLGDAELSCVKNWIASLPKGCEACGIGECVDLASNPSHCGECNVACASGARCEGGTCMCAEGRTECGDACVSTISNPAHCGDCDSPCSGNLVCSLGTCKSTCDAPLMNCNGACVDTMTDGEHCGECDLDCGPGTCEGGICNCGPGIDTQTDPENCGSCGKGCAPGQTCVMGACTCAMVSVSFSSSVQPIFTENCTKASCHRGASPQEDLDLSAGNSYDDLVDVPSSQCMDGRKRVLPGDPSESYLMDKILGVDLCSGTKMPKVDTLPPSDIAIISKWICSGAPDN